MMLGVALGRAPAGLAVAGDRPALEARACAAGGRRGRRPRRAARSRSPPPTPPGRGGASGRRVLKRSIGSRRCPSAETTKSLLRHVEANPTESVRCNAARRRSVQASDGGGAAVTKRWKQRPDGSTWGDWGDDDELGRINLLTPEKVLAGRARGRGRHQLLPEPAARLPRRHRAEPAAPPAACSRRPRTWTATPTTFYNVHMSEMPDFGDPQVRRRVGRRRGDALAAVLDAVGLARPRRRRVRRRRRRRRGGRLLQRLPRRRRPRRPEARRRGRRRRPPLASPTTSASSTWRSTACRAAACSSTSRHHLGPRLARRRPRRRSRRSWRPTASSSSPATCSCSTPASPPRSSSGTATPTR